VRELLIVAQEPESVSLAEVVALWLSESSRIFLHRVGLVTVLWRLLCEDFCG